MTSINRKWWLLLLLGAVVVLVVVRAPQYGDFMGVNLLDPGQVVEVDRIVDAYRQHYDYINIALVREGQIVLTKSYGQNRLKKTDVYASVSKPVTAMIFMQLLEEGAIESVQDDIARYDRDYADVMPATCSGEPLTFFHLLTHQSGVSHLSEMWQGDVLNLAFCPGMDVMYSSNAFGILGDVMEQVTGMSYPDQVVEYIGRPIGADSFSAAPWFQSPAGQVRSTIDDMARFAIGVMDETYVSAEALETIVFHDYARDEHGGICLGWYCSNVGGPDLVLYHAGSNGRPRAFLSIMPYQDLAVAITGMSVFENSPQRFEQLAVELMTWLNP